MKSPVRKTFSLKPLARFTLLSSAVTFAALSSIVSPLAFAEGSQGDHQLNIPGGNLESALTELAKVTGVTLSYRPDVISGQSTEGIQGYYSIAEAIALLLTNSNLQATPQNNGSYTIELVAAHSSQSSPTTLFDAIIVKGQKIEHSLQDTKESVAVLTQQNIEQRGLKNLDDIFQHTAGISASGDTFRTRGIDSGQIGVSRPELASIYIDGAPLVGWLKAEGPHQLWDVNQVEVLRGPQSTNLGRNALAGAIVISTNDPKYENSGRLQVGVSENGGQELNAIVNANLIDGVSALRLTFGDNNSDGFVNNITRDEKDYDNRNRRNLRLKWLFEPNEDLRLVLSLQDIDNHNGNGNVILGGNGFSVSKRIATSDQRANFGLEAQVASLQVNYQLNDSWQLQSTTSGLTGRRTRFNDFDSTSNNGGQVDRYAKDKNMSQELRFNFDNGFTRNSSGIYLAKSESRNENNSVLSLDLAQSINSLSPGLGTTLVGSGLYPSIYNVQTGGFNEIEIKSTAIFSEWDIDFDNDWTFSFGARYNREKQEVSLETTGSSTTTLPTTPTGFGPAVDGAIATINPVLSALSTNQPLQEGNTDFNAFIPHVGATYHWDDNTSTSFFIKKGYRSGGLEVTQIGSTNSYDAEYLLNYEFSLRSIILNNKGVLNANIYYGDWKDQQVDVPVFTGSNTFTQIKNAGKSKIYGIEGSFTYAINNALSLYATAALNKTEYKEFVTNNGDFSGNEFAFAPEVTGSLGVNYMLSNSLSINANTTYQGSSFADQENTVRLDSHLIANITSTYQYKNLTAELYVTNLFDKVYTTDSFSFNGLQVGTTGAPRHLGGRLTWSF